MIESLVAILEVNEKKDLICGYRNKWKFVDTWMKIKEILSNDACKRILLISIKPKPNYMKYEMNGLKLQMG